jgi:hypothetical protein
MRILRTSHKARSTKFVPQKNTHLAVEKISTWQIRPSLMQATLLLQHYEAGTDYFLPPSQKKGRMSWMGT